MKSFLSHPLSLTKALTWIILSLLFISGSLFKTVQLYRLWQYRKTYDPAFHIQSIVQTGPQKEALKTEYLAELMGISCDHPLSIYAFDAEQATKALLSSPVIKWAKVSMEKRGCLLVEYQVRQPVAIVSDFDNVALDEEGYLFPIHPFFSPKKLPGIYFDLPPFGSTGVHWNTPLRMPKITLALDMIRLLHTQDLLSSLHITLIDVSKSDLPHHARQELVITCKEQLLFQGKLYDLRRWLRLTPQHYPQQLGNYLQLRPPLLENDRQKIEEGKPIENQVIDLRIESLGFIRSVNS